MTSETRLLLLALASVVGLIVLVARFKLNAFVALLLAALVVGLGSGMLPADIVKGFQDGFGITLGNIAVVVGLGTMLGKLLAESGGAEVIARWFINRFGTRYLHWTLMVVALIVGLPVFFGVGVVLLIPILFTLVRETKLPLLFLGIPVVAGLSVAHGLIPPHPGPMVAIEKLGADTGKTIFYSLIVGVPVAMLAGPLFGSLISRHVHAEVGGIGVQLTQNCAAKQRPSFGLALFTVLLPVLLMLLATLADVTLPKTDTLRIAADFIGSPLVAMLVAVVFSLYSFGTRCGFSAGQLGRFCEDCVGPAASIFLVVGAGGGFGKILDLSGAGSAIASLLKGVELPPLLLAWLVAASIRVAVGSATVAITLAASILAPVVLKTTGTPPELFVLAMGAGSLVLSHLNDGGFWFVKEYYNLTVTQTLKTWTVMETIISVAALLLVLLLDLVV